METQRLTPESEFLYHDHLRWVLKKLLLPSFLKHSFQIVQVLQV